jgi:hypothetical protein
MCGEFRCYETDAHGQRKRHASIQTTMNVSVRAMTEAKRRVNSQVVGLVFGPTPQDLPAVVVAAVA